MTYRLFYVSNYLMDKYNKDIIAIILSSFPHRYHFFIVQSCIILVLFIYDVGVKSPNYDAYGLFRALHSHNPPNYSHIVGLSSHF